MGVFDFLSGPVDGLLSGVGKIIDNVSTTDEERANAKQRLRALETQFRSRILEHREKIAKEQASIIRTEAASSHWLAANVRPATGFTFLLIALYAGVIAPIFGLPGPKLDQIPSRAWTVIMVVLGGYIGSRGVEKVLPRSKWSNDVSSDRNVDAIADKVLDKIGDARQ